MGSASSNNLAFGTQPTFQDWHGKLATVMGRCPTRAAARGPARQPRMTTCSMRRPLRIALRCCTTSRQVQLRVGGTSPAVRSVHCRARTAAAAPDEPTWCCHKNTTLIPVEDAINLFRYMYIFRGYIYGYISEVQAE